MTSNFGARNHPIRRVAHRHDGIDFAAPSGTPVVAAADGEVTFIGFQNRGFGRYVVIAHRYDSETLYAHLSATALGLRVGDTVRAGDEIGAVGRTGMATGPHLHFELRRGGNPIDPTPLLEAGGIITTADNTGATDDDCQSVSDTVPSARANGPNEPNRNVGGARWNFAPL